MYMRKSLIFIFKITLSISVGIILFSCKGIDIAKTGTVEEIYNEGMRLYEEEDYLEAKKLFDIIKLQHPASKYAEYSQFFMAEINFKQNEYIIAAFNYNTLRRIYPTSKFAKVAMYKAAECYYKKSPEYDRDQEYIKKSLQAFQEFQYVYATDSLYDEASKYIEELRENLANKEFFTAELYIKLGSPRSSLLYYDEVLNNYSDTKFFEPAYFGKIKTLKLVRKYDAALGLIDIYLKKFTSNKNAGEIRMLKSELLILKADSENAEK